MVGIGEGNAMMYQANETEAKQQNAAAVSRIIFFSVLCCFLVVDSQKDADSAVQSYCKLLRLREEINIRRWATSQTRLNFFLVESDSIQFDELQFAASV